MIRDWDEAQIERKYRFDEYADHIDPWTVLYSDAITHLHEWFDFVPYEPDEPDHWIVTRRKWRRSCENCVDAKRFAEILKGVYGGAPISDAVRQQAAIWTRLRDIRTQEKP